MCGMNYGNTGQPDPTSSELQRLRADVESLRKELLRMEGQIWRIMIGGTLAVYFLVWVLMQITLVTLRR